MLKRLKSVSTLLFLMGVSTGTAYAVAESGITDVKITQQNGSCTGIVKDTTGETVIGASVVVKGTTNGTITGIDGDFSLNNVKQGDIIQISFVGYKTVEVKWNGQPLNVTLKDDTEMLGEVVVTGYGGQTVTYQSNQLYFESKYRRALNCRYALQSCTSTIRCRSRLEGYPIIR